MPSRCCSKGANELQSRTSRLALFARQSVLCGILGSLKFVVALVSLVQTYTFLMLCKGSLTSESSRVLELNIKAAKKNLRLGILPSIEMFILMPAMFVGLHMFLNVGLVYCLAACWALMFTVCFTVRIAGLLTSCPSVGSPMYKDGFPFPIMHNRDDPINSLTDGEFSNKATPTLSIFKAYALALLFVPFRIITAAAQTVLLAAEIVSLPVVSTSDVFVAVFRALANKISSTSSKLHSTENFQATKETAKCTVTLVKTITTDMLWVVTMGAYGVKSLRTATKFRGDNNVELIKDKNKRESPTVANNDNASSAKNSTKSHSKEETKPVQQNAMPGKTPTTDQAQGAVAPDSMQASVSSTSCCCKKTVEAR